MLKKAVLAVFGLVLVVTLMAPHKAVAQVNIGVTIGRPAAVVVQPAPVVVQPAPYVAYDEPYLAAHYWISGFHAGYYYDHGTRYRLEHGHRHYDDRYREARLRYDRGHHEHHDHGHDYEHHDHGHDDR